MLEIDNKLIQKFQEDGFLLFKKAIPKEITEPILEVAKVHLKYKIPPVETEAEYIKEDKKIYKESIRRLRQVYDRDIVFRRWMESSLFCNYFRAILNDNPILVTAHHNSIMTKLPKTSTQTRWHQDIRYWSYSNSNLFSIWLALGEENSQNGVLEFIPGSHKMSFSKEQFDKKLYFREDLEQNRKLISKKVSFDLEAGDVILFHSLLLHRANKNSTNNPKISFVYTVKGEKTKALSNSRSAKFKEIELC